MTRHVIILRIISYKNWSMRSTHSIKNWCCLFYIYVQYESHYRYQSIVQYDTIEIVGIYLASHFSLEKTDTKYIYYIILLVNGQHSNFGSTTQKTFQLVQSPGQHDYIVVFMRQRTQHIAVIVLYCTFHYYFRRSSNKRKLHFLLGKTTQSFFDFVKIDSSFEFRVRQYIQDMGDSKTNKSVCRHTYFNLFQFPNILKMMEASHQFETN